MAKTVYLCMEPGRIVTNDVDPAYVTVYYAGVVTENGTDPWQLPQSEVTVATLDVATTLRFKIVTQVKADYPGLLLATFIWLNLV